MAGEKRFDRLRQGWSPFARPSGSTEEAAGAAILLAAENEHCPVHDLTAARYSKLRRSRPDLGLPRAIVLRRVCGSWEAALDAADARASALARQTVGSET